ncbi:hypothetical protein R5W24_004441 [Gemmata sp. JC717]|uniref:hypothetical protein n=1 Tax=Gemmata algarum TaxID=2975278 RepID=UPI0021BB7ABE|nr:hypothetical protein [Gemmata algarum]MDY3555300.1 hypothetical protein [Gemmata algarum]
MIYAYESPDSREVDFGPDGGEVLRFNVITTAGETEAQVVLYVLAGTFPVFNGYIRQRLRITPNGAAHMWRVEVPYGTAGVNGGDQPFGGEASDGAPPEPPAPPASDAAPLTSGYSFSIRAPKQHYLYSRATASAVKRGGGVAPDYKRAIGVDSDGKIAGVEWPPEPAMVFKRTIARASVSQAYLATLADLAGRTNNAPFYGFGTEEALFIGAEGQWMGQDGWSITFEIGIQQSENGIVIVPGELPHAPDVINKKGWHYLWVKFSEAVDTGGNVVSIPQAAYVEQIVRPAPFNLLGIGA